MFKNIFNEWASRSNNAQKVEEAMDPVDKKELKGKHKDRKDKDIDNDGDVDSSDKFLHKRRKAITKAMKKGKDKEGDVEMNPKMDKGSKDNSMEQKEDYDPKKDHNMDPTSHVTKDKKTGMFCVYNMNKQKVAEFETKPEADAYARKNHDALMKPPAGTKDIRKEPTDESYTDVPKVGTSMKQKRKNAAHDKIMKHAKATATANVLKKMKSNEVRKESTIREKLLAVLENKQTKGATPPETMDDKLKGKGAKDMVNQPKEVDDSVTKGHDDASKAGKVTKPAKARNSGDQVRSGDQSIVNKVVDALKGMK